MHIIAIVNQKGGVGKTTTALNVGYMLAELGQRVLLVDLDPQAGLTILAGVDPYHLKRSVYSLLMFDQVSLGRVLQPLEGGVALVPASIDLASATVQIVQERRPLRRLNEVLRGTSLPFDYVLIDTPPTLDPMVAMSLWAADEVIVPVRLDFFAARSVRIINETIERLRLARHGTAVELRGILPTMVDTTSVFTGTVLNELQALFPGDVFDVRIPYDIQLLDAAYRGRAIVEPWVDSPATRAYRALTGDLLGQPSPMEA